jgi:predicted PurR-regulated permease PerM
VGARYNRTSNILFAGLFGIALFLFSRILLPFFMPVLLGAFLVVLFMPAHDFLRLRVLGGRDSVSAGLCTLMVVLVLVLPLAVVGYLVLKELSGIMEATSGVLARMDVRDELKAQLPAALRRYVHLDGQGMEKALLGMLAGSAGFVSEMLTAGTEMLIGVFLMVIAMYYFFLDGRRLVEEGSRLVPLKPRYYWAFVKEFKDVAYAIIYGNTMTAVLQGVTGFAGLAIAKVPNAALWSAAMTVMAMIPIGGTALVWGPIGLVLILTNHVAQGIFVLAWGACFVSAFDNMIRPRLCGAKMDLHPLLVFLSMFGGIAVFGMMGLLVGPLIAALFMAMLKIYRNDFLPRPPDDVVVTEPMVPVVPEPVTAPLAPVVAATPVAQAAQVVAPAGVLAPQ